MVDGQFATLEYAREYLAAQREPIGAREMTAVAGVDVGDNLGRLVVNGREIGVGAEGETIHLHGHNMKPLLENVNQRSEIPQAPESA